MIRRTINLVPPVDWNDRQWFNLNCDMAVNATLRGHQWSMPDFLSGRPQKIAFFDEVPACTGVFLMDELDPDPWWIARQACD